VSLKADLRLYAVRIGSISGISPPSARHSRASEGYPARSFVEAIFWQKTVKGGTRK